MEVKTMDEVLKMDTKELAAWVASWVSMDEFTFETLFAVENIDGEAFCCLTKDEVDKLFPLIGQRCKFQSWFNKLRMPEFSFFSEIDKGEDVSEMTVMELKELIALACPSHATTLANHKIDGFALVELPTEDVAETINARGDLVKFRIIKKELLTIKSKGKRPGKRRRKISKEKRRQYSLNAGSNYIATWVGPETSKQYSNGWNDGKKIFYRKKMSKPKERGSITPPGFWDVHFPDDYVIPETKRKQPAPGSYGARRRARFRARSIQKTISETKTS